MTRLTLNKLQMRWLALHSDPVIRSTRLQNLKKAGITFQPVQLSGQTRYPAILAGQRVRLDNGTS